MRKTLRQGYELHDDTARIDRDAVHRFISEESYWATGRPREVMAGLIDRASRNVGLYAPDGSLAGYARTVDAHGLYEKLGFAPGERLLERAAR